MRMIFIFMFFIFTTFAETMQPVSFVDSKRFSGLWYEIARTYNDYEKDCVAATVEYILEEENQYRVYNRCFDTTMTGDLILYEGTAEPLEGDSMHQIEMTYFWIFSKDYNVLYLEEDYSTAIISDKHFEQLWIMHRKPEISQEKLATLLALLENSMNLDRLIYTPQDPQGRYK
ncbi:lipocalin family protein [Campylobacterota bacterium]